MKKMKTKLFTTVAMLTVSAITLSTASYAWFTMNKEASATGLSLTATAPSNLLISTTSADTGFVSATATFATPTKKFVPVSGSSLDKAAGDKTPTFFYATENTNDGVVSTGFKGATFAAIPGASDTNRQYYADIDLWIKSEKALDPNTTMNLYVKSVNFATASLSDAYRVAINDKTNPTTTNYVYAKTPDRKWTPLKTETTLETAEKTADTVNIDTAVVATIPNDGTAQKITLRIWLEGQDIACVKANAANVVTFAITFAGKEIVK